MKYSFRRLEQNDLSAIKELFVSVFSKEPWNDDWSDEHQLCSYLFDLTGQSNSLTFGLYEAEELVALSMGRVKHWYSGTEYCIDELCVKTERQGQGIGALFISEIENACKQLEFTHLFLLTENNVPAFHFYQKQNFSQLKSNAAFVKKL